jgi:hypothetical protein
MRRAQASVVGKPGGERATAATKHEERACSGGSLRGGRAWRFSGQHRGIHPSDRPPPTPTSPVADLPGTAPGHIVPNAHHESSLHYASSGFAAWMPTVRAPLSSTVCSVRSTSTELRDLDESMIFCLGLWVLRSPSIWVLQLFPFGWWKESARGVRNQSTKLAVLCFLVCKRQCVFVLFHSQ